MYSFAESLDGLAIVNKVDAGRHDFPLPFRRPLSGPGYLVHCLIPRAFSRESVVQLLYEEIDPEPTAACHQKPGLNS